MSHWTVCTYSSGLDNILEQKVSQLCGFDPDNRCSLVPICVIFMWPNLTLWFQHDCLYFAAEILWPRRLKSLLCSSVSLL